MLSSSLPAFALHGWFHSTLGLNILFWSSRRMSWQVMLAVYVSLRPSVALSPNSGLPGAAQPAASSEVLHGEEYAVFFNSFHSHCR